MHDPYVSPYEIRDICATEFTRLTLWERDARRHGHRSLAREYGAEKRAALRAYKAVDQVIAGLVDEVIERRRERAA